MFSFFKRHYRPEPVDDGQLAALEAEYSLQLPELLKDFYRSQAGRPMHPVTFTANGKPYTVVRFLPLFKGLMPVDHLLDIFRLCGRFPQGFFPLAVSEEGDDYFLDTENDGIYLVSMDRPDRHEPVLESLEEFFTRLELAYCSEHQLAPRSLQNAAGLFALPAVEPHGESWYFQDAC